MITARSLTVSCSRGSALARRLGIDPAVGGNQSTQDGTFVERDPIHRPEFRLLPQVRSDWYHWQNDYDVSMSHSDPRSKRLNYYPVDTPKDVRRRTSAESATPPAGADPWPLSLALDHALYCYRATPDVISVDPTGMAVPAALAAAIKVFILAEATCIVTTGVYALKKFLNQPNRSDRFFHCYASCLIARNCAKIPSALTGFLWEMKDEISQWLGWDPEGYSVPDMLANRAGLDCAGWETHIPLIGLTSWLFRQDCWCCCSATYSASGGLGGGEVER